MLIKNALIYGEFAQDVRIENERFLEFASDLKPRENEEIIDASGLVMLPSFVDLGVNLKNDKFSLKNLDLLEADALRGGFCAVLLRDCMSFNDEAYALFLKELQSRKLGIFSSVKVLDKNEKLRNLATFLNNKATAIELESALNANVLRITFQYSLMKDAPLFINCFEPNFDDQGVMNACQTSFELGLVGQSAVSETSEVAKICEIAKFYGARVVFDFLSLKRSLDLAEGFDILISIHHLIKDESACADFNTAAKIQPPLRNSSDAKALKNALKDGKIKFLSSLHSPKSLNLKDLAFDEASFGIHSICEFISLCYTFLIKDGFLSWRELCEFCAKNPAEFLGINSGILKSNYEANFVLFDEKGQSFTPKDSLYSALCGKIHMHFIKGKMV